jgi:hypothetical protein
MQALVQQALNAKLAAARRPDGEVVDLAVAICLDARRLWTWRTGQRVKQTQTDRAAGANESRAEWYIRANAMLKCFRLCNASFRR